MAQIKFLYHGQTVGTKAAADRLVKQITAARLPINPNTVVKIERVYGDYRIAVWG